jgi:hypothetical protein
MSVESHRVLIGACGWQHSAWLNDFYDEDLPEEWRLGFYSNEFPVVYVEAADWCRVQGSTNNAVDLSEWPDEVSENFRFILELPAQVFESKQLFEHVLNQARQLGEFCLGLVIQLEPDIRYDEQSLKNYLTLAGEVATVVVDSGGVSLSSELKQLLEAEGVSELWRGDAQDNEKLNGGSLAVARVNSNGLEPTELRKVIESCLSASSEDCVSVLCFDGKPPSLEVMRNADIILNLL